MPLEKEIGDAATALSQNQYIDALDGTYWIDGWDATLGTGDLEVDIAPGEGAINTGDVETTATQTVDFTGDLDATNPRKGVISVDDTGTVQKTLGDAMPADPEGEVRERTFDPAPPTNAPGVVVAEVWLAAGATALVSEDVRDRRVSNNAIESFEAPSFFGGFVVGRGVSVPETVRQSSATGIDGSIYLFGGNYADSSGDTVYKFNPIESSWSTVSPLPQSNTQGSATEVNGKGYSIGGGRFSADDAVYEYDPVADSWSTVAPLPEERAGLSATEVGGKIYAIGGFDLNDTTQDTVYEYDPAADSWSTVAPLPEARRELAAVSFDGRAYAIGGEDDNGDAQDTVYEYNPETDSWSQFNTLFGVRYQLAGASIDTAVYAIGGRDNGSNEQSDVWTYFRAELAR